MTSYVSPVAFTTVAQSIPPNVFADMDRKVAVAVAGGADVIDLAKGNPDAFPADFIRDVAKQAVDDPANARYSPFMANRVFCRRPSIGIAIRTTSTWIGRRSCLRWRAPSMDWRRCLRCWCLRETPLHTRIRIIRRTIA